MVAHQEHTKCTDNTANVCVSSRLSSKAMTYVQSQGASVDGVYDQSVNHRARAGWSVRIRRSYAHTV